MINSKRTLKRKEQKECLAFNNMLDVDESILIELRGF